MRLEGTAGFFKKKCNLIYGFNKNHSDYKHSLAQQKLLTIVNVGEDMEQPEFSNTWWELWTDTIPDKKWWECKLIQPLLANYVATSA